MGSSQLPELLEHWVSTAGFGLAIVVIMWGIVQIIDSFWNEERG
jgi:hypothetical protein